MYTVLHVSLEYTYGIGGLKSVISGLLPALQKNNIPTSIVTPFYDFIQNTNIELEELANIKHYYKKTVHTSVVFQVKNTKVTQLTTPVHYLIKPQINSPVAKIFDIGDQLNIYRAFRHSEPQNRIEYFNGAISSFIRISQPQIPTFDIVHTHCWHTGLSVCLIKEFDQLHWVKILNTEFELNAIPKIISSIHMLSEEQGSLNGKKDIVDTLTSVGLTLDTKFLINNKNLNQMYLGLQYSDQALMVSKSVANDAINGKDYNLSRIFNTLNELERLNAINNGITINTFNPTLIENLGQYALKINNINSIIEQKRKIKNFLSAKYRTLNLNQGSSGLWYLYLARFGKEKGIDMLPCALDAILECNGSLIVMGCYINDNDKNENSVVGNIISHLKSKINVVVIDNHYEQSLIGKYFRAACEFTLVPSHVEACGLIAMEAMLNCSIPITSDVQGLPDTVISLIENESSEIIGTGFLYHEEQMHGKKNLQDIIKKANSMYISWQQTKKLDLLLNRLHKESIQFDWKETPVKKYLQLYEKTIKKSPPTVPHIVQTPVIIKVLHVALEYKEATLGGLGIVTTQLLKAQNEFDNGTKFDASIITPYYPIFTASQSGNKSATYVTNIFHAYNEEQVQSVIYLINNNNNKHFLVKPSLKYNDLFNIDSVSQIYSSDNNFIERMKYFNSAAAAFIAKCMINGDVIIQLHGWSTALTAAIIREVYKLATLKIVYTLHINNKDRGRYFGEKLSGFGMRFPNKLFILKQIGIEYSDYIVGVSPSILTDCSVVHYAQPGLQSIEIQNLAKSFLQAKYSKKSLGILNGIDYKSYCKIQKLINNSLDIIAGKNKIKQQLAKKLTGNFSLWKINPDLPIILYIGRFSPEKGVECFQKIISIIDKKAIFFALGKGFNKEVFKLIMQDSRQKDNIFITFSPQEQEEYGDLMRAAADFTFVPSREEACGLVAMEGFANGSICITSGVGGLKDFVIPFKYQDGFSSGNGCFYNDKEESSLLQTITFILDLWKNIPPDQKNVIHNRIIKEAERFDWLATNGSVQKYFELFSHILAFQESKNSYRLNGLPI